MFRGFSLMNRKKMKYTAIQFILLFPIWVFFSCADNPIHDNVYDPETPNETPLAVTLSTELVSGITNHTMTIGWTESGEDDFYGYHIYRSATPGVDTNSTLLASYPYPFMIEFTDTGLAPNTNYNYKVYTEDKGGLTAASNELSFTTSPNIEFEGRLITDGAGTENLYHYSKSDMIINNGVAYVCFAVLERDWDLYLDVKNFQNASGHGVPEELTELITGDSDGDDQPDMYEIFANSDHHNPNMVPAYDFASYPHVTPNQILVYVNPTTGQGNIFVFFRHGDHYPLAKVIKFTGNWTNRDFHMDDTWFEHGVYRLDPCNTIAKYSASELMINNGEGYKVYGLSGNLIKTVELGSLIGLLTVGYDTPGGEKRIYMTHWDGEILKYDDNGNLLMSWQGFWKNAGTLVPMSIFADDRGNVFITDPGLNTVNRYDSSGNLISRWEGVNIENHYTFYFNDMVATYNHASIIGGNFGDNIVLFIVDMNAFFCKGVY